MVNLNRITIKVAGESGQGINSMGEMLAKIFKNSGNYLFATREYPSLIKGGYANYQLDISSVKINASSRYCDILVCVSRLSIHKYLKTLRLNGTLIHNINQVIFSVEEESFIESNNIKVLHVKSGDILKENHLPKIVTSVFMVAILVKMFDFPLEELNVLIEKIFEKKIEVVEINKIAARLGFNVDISGLNKIEIEKIKVKSNLNNSYLITGNDLLSIGSYAAGVRAYYSYPMTPASSILSYLADVYNHTKMLVKQVDDEITAVQMAIGSMFMGTRALVGTSGGGFDLMTETISLSGMTETPLVVILAQRPGPATGLPTWTAQGDLDLAVYSGHGEYPRLVIALSDIESCYTLVGNAFNYAEIYQVPVLILTDKQIAESLFVLDSLPEQPVIQRGLVDSSELHKLIPQDRYKLTQNGISKRWLPGDSETVYLGNSDEHLEDGSLTEESIPSKDMMDKRMRKLSELKNNILDPILFGDESGDILFVGWGSTKNTLLDSLPILNNQGIRSSYLHFDYILPLKADKLVKIKESFKRIVLIEGNNTGQLGRLLSSETGFIFKERLLKYDGRAFFVEDILEYLQIEFVGNKNSSGARLRMSL
jgi:2-oxoglutarate ferredoxin oxidoreductase subunit alpha